MSNEIPTYTVYTVKPLSKIEQRAKEQALEDIHQAIHLELWLEEQSPIGINWATCFDVNNIQEDTRNLLSSQT